jgi:hypothetical protein
VASRLLCHRRVPSSVTSAERTNTGSVGLAVLSVLRPEKTLAVCAHSQCCGLERVEHGAEQRTASCPRSEMPSTDAAAIPRDVVHRGAQGLGGRRRRPQPQHPTRMRELPRRVGTSRSSPELYQRGGEWGGGHGSSRSASFSRRPSVGAHLRPGYMGLDRRRAHPDVYFAAAASSASSPSTAMHRKAAPRPLEEGRVAPRTGWWSTSPGGSRLLPGLKVRSASISRAGGGGDDGDSDNNERGSSRQPPVVGEAFTPPETMTQELSAPLPSSGTGSGDGSSGVGGGGTPAQRSRRGRRRERRQPQELRDTGNRSSPAPTRLAEQLVQMQSRLDEMRTRAQRVGFQPGRVQPAPPLIHHRSGVARSQTSRIR